VQRGISLEDAAVDTCIRASHLRALEDDEPPKDYPGPVYTRFFLREYAEYLELDEEPLLAAFDRTIPAEQVQPLELASPRREPPGWAITAIVSTLVLILILVVSRSADRHVAPGAGAAAAPPPVVAAPVLAAGVATSLPSDPPGTLGSPTPNGSEGIHAVITVTAPCWVMAIVDGEPTTGRTVPAGDTVRLRAHRSIELRLGNAGGAVLRVNGDRYPTGPDGQVRRISLAWRHGELVAV
jgi:cytoskeletal protein RodZ